jgi:hypothetical protein
MFSTLLTHKGDILTTRVDAVSRCINDSLPAVTPDPLTPARPRYHGLLQSWWVSLLCDLRPRVLLGLALGRALGLHRHSTHLSTSSSAVQHPLNNQANQNPELTSAQIPAPESRAQSAIQNTFQNNSRTIQRLRVARIVQPLELLAISGSADQGGRLGALCVDSMDRNARNTCIPSIAEHIPHGRPASPSNATPSVPNRQGYRLPLTRHYAVAPSLMMSEMCKTVAVAVAVTTYPGMRGNERPKLKDRIEHLQQSPSLSTHLIMTWCNRDQRVALPSHVQSQSQSQIQSRPHNATRRRNSLTLPDCMSACPGLRVHPYCSGQTANANS